VISSPPKVSPFTVGAVAPTPASVAASALYCGNASPVMVTGWEVGKAEVTSVLESEVVLAVSSPPPATTTMSAASATATTAITPIQSALLLPPSFWRAALAAALRRASARWRLAIVVSPGV